MLGTLSVYDGVLLFFFSCKLVEARLGTIIHGQLDQLERGVLFTDAFVARQMACIRGVFSAITKYIITTTFFHCHLFCFVC